MQHRSLVGIAMLPAVTLLFAERGFAETSGSGVTFDTVYTGDQIRNLSGGIRTGGTYLDNLDLQLSVDRGSLFGIPGLSGFVYVLYNNSSEFSSEYVGDAQVVSNIDTSRATRLYEAWLDWAPGDADGLSARLGLYDLNSEFDSIETAALFLNSSHGIGADFSQSGLNGPSIFPVTSLALRLRTGFGNGAYGQLAVLDGVPGDPEDPSSNEIDLSSDDGALIATELGWSGDNWRKVAVGYWRYTADFDRLDAVDPAGDPVRDDGNAGWYLIADRWLMRGDSAQLAGYVRGGQAEGRYNPFDFYLGAGATLSGFSRSRPDDELGIAVANSFTGSEYRDAAEIAGTPVDRTETAIELTWRAPVTEWLTLQPDLQYIINPGTDPTLDDAFVVALRFEIALSWAP